MANKSVYQDFDTDALTYFGLEQDTLYGVLSNSGEVTLLVTFFCDCWSAISWFCSFVSFILSLVNTGYYY